MKALFAILLAILVIDTTVQVNLRLLSQHVQREMRQQRILPKQNGVQETDEEDQNSQTANKQKVTVDAQTEQKVTPGSEVQSQTNQMTQDSQTAQSNVSNDDYNKDELPDTEQDIKNYQEREKQLREAMKNVTPKDETKSLDLMIFSLFFGLLGIFM